MVDSCRQLREVVDLLLGHNRSSSLGRVTLNGLSGRRQAGEGLATKLLSATEHGAGTLKVGVHGTLEESVFSVDVNLTILVGVLAGNTVLPLRTVVMDLLLVIEFGVVVFAGTTEAFPDRQVLGVDGNTVVFVLTAVTDVPPATLLFLEVETGSVGKP